MGTKLATTALALILTAPGLALAQQQSAPAANDPAAQTGAPAPGTAAAPGTTTPPAVGQVGVGTTTATTGAGGVGGDWWSNMRGDQIVGQTLYGAQGEEIGEVDNVVLNAEGGKPAAVVGVGGFLGLGERNVTIPLKAIQRGAEDRLTTTMNRDQIAGLEEYQEGGGWRPFTGGGTLGAGGEGNR